jgi:uncharacterized protein (DUF983 family)
MGPHPLPDGGVTMKILSEIGSNIILGVIVLILLVLLIAALGASVWIALAIWKAALWIFTV